MNVEGHAVRAQNDSCAVSVRSFGVARVNRRESKMANGIVSDADVARYREDGVVLPPQCNFGAMD